MFFSREVYNRDKLIEYAARAANRRKYKKALKYYQKALENEHDNHELHGRIAPLLARVKRLDEAMESFERAANGYLARGFIAKAVGVYTSAAAFFPKRIEIWELLGDLKLNQKQPRDAFQILLKGRHCFRKRSERDQAAQLLKKALKILPEDVDATIDLARVLRRQKRSVEALRWLNRLAGQKAGADLRKLRWQIFLTSPSWSRLWEWMRSMFS